MEEKLGKLRDLETKRSDVAEKLKRIDEKKSTVSVDVYNKVKKEYEDKLKKIEDKLGEYVDLITEEVKHLRSEESKVVEEEKAIKMKIEEAELRYSIGEYDDESFKKENEEHKGNLKTILDKLADLRERIKWFEDFVEIKGLEKTLEVEAKAPAEKDIEIEEHILEEKVPEGIQLDELLMPEEAVKPDAAAAHEMVPEEPAPPPKKKSGEKGVICPKCKAVNAPDSWYCEKCGAEILDSLPPQ
jgi:chromosome segregation ATPase